MPVPPPVPQGLNKSGALFRASIFSCLSLVHSWAGTCHFSDQCGKHKLLVFTYNQCVYCSYTVKNVKHILVPAWQCHFWRWGRHPSRIRSGCGAPTIVRKACRTQWLVFWQAKIAQKNVKIWWLKNPLYTSDWEWRWRLSWWYWIAQCTLSSAAFFPIKILAELQ